MTDNVNATAKQGRNEWLVLCILVLLAAGVRTWIAANTYLISTDSAVFLRSAEFFREGELTEALALDFHPLYPLAMAGLSRLSGLDLESCGVIISIALGSLTILPLYFITRELFNPLAGVLAALALVFHPYSAKQSADIMSEAAYIFFLISGAWALLWGMKRGSVVFIAMWGTCSGLAYLVRPEGLGLLIAGMAWMILCRAAKVKREMRVTGIVLAVTACVVVAGPYILHLSRDMEGFDIPLSRKKSVFQLLGIKKKTADNSEQYLTAEEARTKLLEKQLYGYRPEARSKPKQLLDLAGEFSRTMGFFGLASIAGVIALLAARNRAWGNMWLLFILIVYSAVLTLLYLNVYRSQTPSQRHVLPLVTVCMVWAGYGLERLTVWIRGALGHRASPALAGAAPVILLLIIFTGSEIYLMRPRRLNQLGVKYMAEIIDSQGVSSPLIMTSEEKLPYYAGGRLITLPPVNNERVTADRLIEYAKLAGVHFIVVSEEDCDPAREHSFKFLDPENHDPRLELLERRADEPAVRKRYRVDVELDDDERFIAYRIKRGR